MITFPRLLLAFIGLLVLGACKKGAHSSGGGHAHTAPHGGTLVPLGEHAYNAELVRDSAAGKLTLYVLDGHAESFVRIEAPSLALVFTIGGEPRGLLLRAVANQATGETVGNTSQFEAEAEWLKGSGPLDGAIKTLPVRGSVFSDVAFKLP